MPGMRIPTDLEQAVEQSVRKAERQARSFYGLDLPAATIDLTLRGRCAGQARIEGGRALLRFNRQLLVENRDDFLKTTVPHEVAHLVVNWPFRRRRQRPRPHGPEWQAVMQDCFGLAPERCHSYRTTPARVVPRPFIYACVCREHRLTSIMHRRISRSRQALCRACKAPIRFVARQLPRGK
jgi:SprT protein